jgi:POT family proton-dependent oligopeptide transporter
MAVLAGVTGIIFWFSIRSIDAQEDALNSIREGNMDNHARVVEASEK